MFNALPNVETLRAEAEAAHAQYPQYAGYWDTWVLGVIKRDIKTKLGLAFRKGDVVLVQPIVRDLTGESFANRKDLRSLTCYSFRNKCNTGIWLDLVDVDVNSFFTQKGA